MTVELWYTNFDIFNLLGLQIIAVTLENFTDFQNNTKEDKEKSQPHDQQVHGLSTADIADLSSPDMNQKALSLPNLLKKPDLDVTM